MLLCVVLAVAFAQEVIENTKTPLNESAGRVLKLEEEFRIESEGEGYFFDAARKLQLDESGNIYLCDSWSSRQRSHLLKFSPEGKFLKDLKRQGEGPGEIQSSYDFVLGKSEVYLFDRMKRKVVVLDHEGKFKREFKPESGSIDELVGVFEEWLVFWRDDNPTERKTSRLYDVKNVIQFVSKDGQVKKDFYTFINQQFFVSPAQGGGWMNWDPFVIVMGDNRLFVCRSSEYLIEVLDLASGEIETRFRRKFTRVGHEQEKWEKDFVSRFNAPKKRFDHDVEDLLYDRGRLCVKTSIEDREKGVLFDLFDRKGQFLDSFFINLHGRVLRIDGDFLYVAESDEDELPLVVKYRIIS